MAKQHATMLVSRPIKVKKPNAAADTLNLGEGPRKIAISEPRSGYEKRTVGKEIKSTKDRLREALKENNNKLMKRRTGK